MLEEVTGKADETGKMWNREPSPRTAAWWQNKGQPLVPSTGGIWFMSPHCLPEQLSSPAISSFPRLPP